MIRLNDAFEDLAARARPDATDPSRVLAVARSEASRRNRRRRVVVAGMGLGVAATLTVALGIWSDDHAPGVETRNLPVATDRVTEPPPTSRPAHPPGGTNVPAEPAPAEAGPAPDAWSDDRSSDPLSDSPSDPPAEGGTWSDETPRPPGTTTSTLPPDPP